MGLFKKEEKGPICPLLNGPCVKDGCTFWTHVIGVNPQTGKNIDNFDCAIKWLPIMLVENAQMTRQTNASVQSFRNEASKAVTGILEESERRRDLEERRLNVDERLLEHQQGGTLKIEGKK